jgi:hypothetical protein
VVEVCFAAVETLKWVRVYTVDMVRKTTFPTTFGNEGLTIGFGYGSGDVGVHADRQLTAYADRVVFDPDDDSIATVWFKSGDESVGFVYMDEHVARRVAIEAEHAGTTVEGLE